jgi:hypothetical protein
MSLFPAYPELDASAFAALVEEWDGPGRRPQSILADDVASENLPEPLSLLQVAEHVHREQPFPSDAFTGLKATELLSLGERTSEEFGNALGFIPRADRLLLGRWSAYDPGLIAEKCESLFALYLVRSAVRWAIAAAQVEVYALLIELWRRLRQEELRRLQGSPIGVLAAMILKEEPEALEILNRRYLNKKVMSTLQNALRRTPTIIERVRKPDGAELAIREEAVLERDRLVAEQLHPFVGMRSRDFYLRLMDSAAPLHYLPANVRKDAQNLLEKLTANKRTLPPGSSLDSVDTPLDGLDDVTMKDTMSERDLAAGAEVTLAPAAEQATQLGQALKLIEDHLGRQAAQVVNEFTKPGPPPTAVQVAENLGCSEKTISRVLGRIQKDSTLRAALLDLLRT